MPAPTSVGKAPSDQSYKVGALNRVPVVLSTSALRGTLGSVRVEVAHHTRPGTWLFYAEEAKAKGNGYKVEMLDGGCTLLTPRWPKKKKRKTAAPKPPRGDAA